MKKTILIILGFTLFSQIGNARVPVALYKNVRSYGGDGVHTHSYSDVYSLDDCSHFYARDPLGRAEKIITKTNDTKVSITFKFKSHCQLLGYIWSEEDIDNKITDQVKKQFDGFTQSFDDEYVDFRAQNVVDNSEVVVKLKEEIELLREEIRELKKKIK